ncbi:MAG: sugar phosphate isomerase/epimerase [Spirochaetales bacterium]|jgi:sugar phosphate isomerase/epimerase|nr:sugar phosphate isomerase/epimerase [Spirochaetales bacterium]
MSFKLACADFAFPLLTHDNSLDLISMLGFEGIDIGLFEGRSHLWPSVEFQNLKKSARDLNKKLNDRGLKAADVFLQMNPDFVPFAINHPEQKRRKKARDWFHQSLDYAEAIGCHHLTTLPGVVFEGVPRSESLNRACDELAWRLEESRARGLTFAIEAHVGSIVSRPKSALSLLEKVAGLTLTLDYTHFTKLGIADTEIEPLLPFASHFHARGSRKGRLQTSFDKNTVDYKRIVRQMRKYEYTGYIGIEYIWIDWEHCNEVDNLSETILYRDFFRTF